MVSHPFTTEELLAANILPLRPGRLRDFTRESRALDALVGRINTAPDKALQALVATASELCGAGSAGVSLLHEGAFVWPAIAGAWAPFVGQGLPQDASPCGVVIDQKVALLFDRPKRLLPNIDVLPEIQEILLVPLLFGGHPEGTLWVISHDQHRFDAEDVRILERLALMATAIEQTRRLCADQRRHAESARDRMRSTVAVIRSLLRQAEADAHRVSNEAALTSLKGRTDAFLGGIVGNGLGTPTDLWLLIADTLLRCGEQPGGRVRLEGPDVSIWPQQAGPLELAFHELLDNAFEHGALKRNGGKVDITWSTEQRDGRSWLHLLWREDGGPVPVSAKPLRGFGFDLLSEGLPDLIAAATQIELQPTGLLVSLRLPLTPHREPGLSPHQQLE